jgi:CheY-like chemotaxis protein
MVVAEGSHTVLVVDDEPAIRVVLVEVLSDLGYTTIEAADGVIALKILQFQYAGRFLITDIGLPNNLNGRQLFEQARVLRPELKVLFITGYAENAVLHHGRLEPGMHVMMKPFGLAALAARVREILGQT